jgi:hypothetical protein
MTAAVVLEQNALRIETVSTGDNAATNEEIYRSITIEVSCRYS